MMLYQFEDFYRKHVFEKNPNSTSIDMKTYATFQNYTWIANLASFLNILFAFIVLIRIMKKFGGTMIAAGEDAALGTFSKITLCLSTVMLALDMFSDWSLVVLYAYNAKKLLQYKWLSAFEAADISKFTNLENLKLKSLKFGKTNSSLPQFGTPELDLSISSQTSKKIDTVGSFFQRLIVALKEMAKSLYFSFDFSNQSHDCDLSKFMGDHQYQYSCDDGNFHCKRGLKLWERTYHNQTWTENFIKENMNELDFYAINGTDDVIFTEKETHICNYYINGTSDPPGIRSDMSAGQCDRLIKKYATEEFFKSHQNWKKIDTEYFVWNCNDRLLTDYVKHEVQISQLIQWAFYTAILAIVPLIITNIYSWKVSKRFQGIREKRRKSSSPETENLLADLSKKKKTAYTFFKITHWLGLGVIVNAARLLFSKVNGGRVFYKKAEIYMLKSMESFLEACPQMMLQAYILLKLSGDIYPVISRQLNKEKEFLPEGNRLYSDGFSISGEKWITFSIVMSMVTSTWSFIQYKNYKNSVIKRYSADGKIQYDMVDQSVVIKICGSIVAGITQLTFVVGRIIWTSIVLNYIDFIEKIEKD